MSEVDQPREGEAYAITETNLLEITLWCGGKQVEEILPDGTKRPAINFQAREGVERAYVGNILIKDGPGCYDVIRGNYTTP